jgi:hypothetical protein
MNQFTAEDTRCSSILLEQDRGSLPHRTLRITRRHNTRLRTSSTLARTQCTPHICRQGSRPQQRVCRRTHQKQATRGCNQEPRTDTEGLRCTSDPHQSELGRSLPYQSPTPITKLGLPTAPLSRGRNAGENLSVSLVGQGIVHNDTSMASLRK